jgi:hypothetical protein
MIEELIVKCEEIEKEINRIQSDSPSIGPISDGIINIQKYLASRFKILWILKESNDVRDGEGGRWSLNKTIDKQESWAEQVQTGRTTFQRMIYSSFGILNDFMRWKDIPEIGANHHVWETIKEIAYINVKKIPGGTSAYPPEIQEAYLKNKALLLKQIDTYNPDIIIGGNTLKHFIEDLQIDENNKRTIGGMEYFPINERLYINAYHPNVRGKTISEEDYCNNIILASKDWVENWKK